MLELRDTEVIICIKLAMLRRTDGRHYLNIDSTQATVRHQSIRI
jgi:hypothetical protein